jgi:hypothetical protein
VAIGHHPCSPFVGSRAVLQSFRRERFAAVAAVDATGDITMHETMSFEQVSRILESSQERAELAQAAVFLANSDGVMALRQLGRYLTRADFLARLDNLEEPHEKTLYLRQVMAPLIERPSPEVAALCHTLYRDATFMSDPDRLVFLLRALAAVSPMSGATAEIFRQTNAIGYYSHNAPLLAANASPAALEVFEQMIRDARVPAERRIDALHEGVLPNRSKAPVLQMCRRLIESELELPVKSGVIESVFDYQGKKWYGPHPPKPPAWRSASNEVLRLVAELAGVAREQPGLPDALRDAIDDTARVVRALLTGRSRVPPAAG